MQTNVPMARIDGGCEMNTDERALLITIATLMLHTNREPWLRPVVERSGMTAERGLEILEKWYADGWFEKGHRWFDGHLTEEGLRHAESIGDLCDKLDSQPVDDCEYASADEIRATIDEIIHTVGNTVSRKELADAIAAVVSTEGVK
jgi:hypothetical protein